MPLHELGIICGTREILPESCTIPGSSLDTVLSFVSGHVYEGTLNGSKVLVERLWMYSNDAPQGVKQVSCLQHYISVSSDSDRIQFLYQTAVVWKQLRHQNIVPLLGITPAPLQLVSEWMAGGDITTYIAKCPHAHRLCLVGVFPPHHVTSLPSHQLLDVAKGLDYLHSCHVIQGGLKGVWDCPTIA